MDRKEILEKLRADHRERRWAAMREIDACAKALGNECDKAIGISYQALNLVLAQLAAAVGAGKCDGAYIKKNIPTNIHLKAVQTEEKYTSPDGHNEGYVRVRAGSRVGGKRVEIDDRLFRSVRD